MRRKNTIKANYQRRVIFFQLGFKKKKVKFDEFWYKYEKDIPMLASKARVVCTSPTSSVGPESSFRLLTLFFEKKEVT